MIYNFVVNKFSILKSFRGSNMPPKLLVFEIQKIEVYKQSWMLTER